MSDAARRLALLEIGHGEAEQALLDLKTQWDREDELLRERRKFILEAHAQGARDRDAMRVRLGGMSLFPTSNEGAKSDIAEDEDTDRDPNTEAVADGKQAAADAWTP